MITIQNVSTGAVLFTHDGDSVRAAVEAAVAGRISLAEANLHGANLAGATIHGADLRRADLYKANLYKADLYEAELVGANLYEATLTGADLSWANLYEAVLYKAEIAGAHLYEACLRRADLRGADLRNADLRGANLTGADLTGADLAGAILPDTHTLTQRSSNMIDVSIDRTTLKAISLFRAKRDTREYLNGAFIERNTNGTFFVASDGIAVALARLAAPSDGEDVRYCISQGDIDTMVAAGSDFQVIIRSLEDAEAVSGKVRVGLKLLSHTMPTFAKVCVRVSDDFSAAGAVPAIYASGYHALVRKAADVFGFKAGGHIRPAAVGKRTGDVGVAQLDKAGMAWAWVAALRTPASEMPSGPDWVK